MRLIDADALLKKLNEEKIPFNSDINSFIISAPTVEQERQRVLLTADYLRGFYDGVTHKDTPAADACREIEKNFTAKGSAIEAARELRRYCRERGPACNGCPFVLDSPSNICTLNADLPEYWKLEFMEGEE